MAVPTSSSKLPRLASFAGQNGTGAERSGSCVDVTGPAATRRESDPAMIQSALSVVLRVMTVAIRIPASFDLPRFRRVARRRVRVAQAAASGTAMSNSSGSTRRRDEWGGRIGAIAREPGPHRLRGALRLLRAAGERPICRGPGPSEAQAEEVAQETMLAVWRKAALFDPGSASAATWIFTIARNLRIDVAAARAAGRRDPGRGSRGGIRDR